jgi:hypothetical protein
VPSTRPHRAFRVTALAISVAVAAAACGPAPEEGGPGDVRLTMQVLVRDGTIRNPGVECSGSRPFLYVHANAAYRVEDAATEEPLLTGSLPAGTAIEAYDEDLGVPRVPTFCLVSWPVVLPPRDEYRLVLEEGEPVAFRAADVDAENRITIVVP